MKKTRRKHAASSCGLQPERLQPGNRCLPSRKRSQHESKDSRGRTPLQCALQNDNESAVEVIRLLLEKGADVYESDFDEYPLIYWASDKKNESAVEIVRLLEEKKA